MKVSGSDPTRRSRGGRRHSGAPGGGVPRKGTWHLLRGADEDVAPIGAPLPHIVRERGKRRRQPRACDERGRWRTPVVWLRVYASRWVHFGEQIMPLSRLLAMVFA